MAGGGGAMGDRDWEGDSVDGVSQCLPTTPPWLSCFSHCPFLSSLCLCLHPCCPFFTFSFFGILFLMSLCSSFRFYRLFPSFLSPSLFLFCLHLLSLPFPVCLAEEILLTFSRTPSLLLNLSLPEYNNYPSIFMFPFFL